MSSILQLADIIAGDVATQLTWLQNRGLLPQRKTCPACNHAMDMQPRNDVCDKFRYSILFKIIHYHIKMGYMMMTVVDNRALAGLIESPFLLGGLSFHPIP